MKKIGLEGRFCNRIQQRVYSRLGVAAGTAAAGVSRIDPRSTIHSHSSITGGWRVDEGLLLYMPCHLLSNSKRT